MQLSSLPNTAEEIKAWLRGARVYPRSIQQAGGEVLCAVKDGHQWYLLAIFNPQLPPFLRDSFGGETQDLSETLAFKWCFPSHSNAKKLRALFPWTAPQNLENQNTLAIRDLIGLAAPALLQAHREDYDFALVFEAAPHEWNNLSRTMDEALDAVTFAVFQENYRRPWAMRATNLKDPSDTATYQKLGYSEFSLDNASGESVAWIEAARQTIQQNAPQLFEAITDKDFLDVWTAKTPSGAWQFRDRIYRLLLDHETEYHQGVKEVAEELFNQFQNTLKKE